MVIDTNPVDAFEELNTDDTENEHDQHEEEEKSQHLWYRLDQCLYRYLKLFRT